MTSAQYRTAIDRLGLTQVRAAQYLGVSLKTSNRYANGARIPEPVARLLTLMIEFGINNKPRGTPSNNHRST